MRRIEKEIRDLIDIESVIRAADICRLAMCDGGIPYLVPLCFGYEDNIVYFHSATEGKKLEMLKKNSNVCFEIDIDQELKPAEKPCAWDMNYKSVIEFGKAEFVEDIDGKRQALDIIEIEKMTRKASSQPSAGDGDTGL